MSTSEEATTLCRLTSPASCVFLLDAASAVSGTHDGTLTLHDNWHEAVTLVDAETRAVRAFFFGHAGRVFGVALHADGGFSCAKRGQPSTSARPPLLSRPSAGLAARCGT